MPSERGIYIYIYIYIYNECARGQVVRALHAYAETSEGELSIEKGDEITVLEEDDSGWWKGASPHYNIIIL